jgi:hypothetical protein
LDALRRNYHCQRTIQSLHSANSKLPNSAWDKRLVATAQVRLSIAEMQEPMQSLKLQRENPALKQSRAIGVRSLSKKVCLPSYQSGGDSADAVQKNHLETELQFFTITGYLIGTSDRHFHNY